MYCDLVRTTAAVTLIQLGMIIETPDIREKDGKISKEPRQIFQKQKYDWSWKNLYITTPT